MKRAFLAIFLLTMGLSVPQALAFTDVTPEDDEEAIDYLYSEDIVDGYPDGTYKPQTPINRAELLKILVESRVEDLPDDGEDCFTDVSEEWYAPYICYAKDEGWVEGYQDGSFGPGKNINRAEAIAMMFKVYAEDLNSLDIEEEDEVVYLDVSSKDWYASYLYMGRASGVLMSKTYFRPSDEITRGDTASALYRLLMALEPESEPEVELTEEEEEEVVVEEEEEEVEVEIVEEEEEEVVVVHEDNPFSGARLYVDPYSHASGIEGLEAIASQPTARWFGDWSGDIEAAADKYVSTVSQSGALPVMVIYNIPGRDCGSYSAGGSSNADNYREWIQGFADGVGDREAVAILEPDALPLDCLYENSTALLADAVSILKSKPGIAVYLDAGHPNWTPADEMAERLQAANVAEADGFALNVSNFYLTEENIEFGKEVSSLVGNKHFIIDTSRNGNGWNGEWCNPSGMSLGQNPTVNTGEKLVDAYLWVKPPGESDGTCNGGPSAGSWWLEYALGLVRN